MLSCFCFIAQILMTAQCMCRGEHRSPAFILSLKFFVCQQIRCTPCSATEKIPASKIRQSRHYPSERDVHFCETKIASLPYNPEITANPEHGRTVFAPTTFRASSTAAKSLRSVLVHNSGQLCPFLTPHLNSTLTSPP